MPTFLLCDWFVHCSSDKLSGKNLISEHLQYFFRWKGSTQARWNQWSVEQEGARYVCSNCVCGSVWLTVTMYWVVLTNVLSERNQLETHYFSLAFNACWFSSCCFTVLPYWLLECTCFHSVAGALQAYSDDHDDEAVPILTFTQLRRLNSAKYTVMSYHLQSLTCGSCKTRCSLCSHKLLA